MDTTTRVIVAEDDPRMANLIRLYFERERFSVTVVADGLAAISAARRNPPHLAIIDLMLPGADGFEVCQVLKAELDPAIIVVTARTAESDVLLALETGADDYVTKPLRPRELVARARAVLRRREGTAARAVERFEVGEVTVDTRRRRAWRGGEELLLTPKEFHLLATLAADPGRVFSRAELADRAFGYDYEGLERTVDQHVSNLRRKVEPEPDRPSYILTAVGMGYRFRDA
ncbi:MAG: response regulator transcription factor [Dehalococcoidia bacterium]